MTILPGWVQYLSAILPASYIFNGMRSILMQHFVRVNDLLIAGGLDLVWLSIGVSAFLMFHQSARERGMLLQLGE